MSSPAPLNPRPITEARLLAMVNASGDSFWETDVARCFVHVSDNMCRLMGYERHEIEGRPVVAFMTPEYRAELVRMAAGRQDADDQLAHTGPIRHEGEFFRKDGSRLWIETVSVPVFDDQGVHLGYFGITRDMTERKLAEQALQAANERLEAQLQHIRSLHAKLQEQAVRDALTGLHNRRHFVAVSESELRHTRDEHRPLSLVVFDVDHFKRINDEHGHPTGDAALRAVGRLFAQAVGAGETAYRIGGEEFAVLLVDTDHPAALARAEAWRHAISELAISASSATVRLTASFGVATVPHHADSLDTLMKVADARLYRAKADGRDRVVGAGG